MHAYAILRQRARHVRTQRRAAPCAEQLTGARGASTDFALRPASVYPPLNTVFQASNVVISLGACHSSCRLPLSFHTPTVAVTLSTLFIANMLLRASLFDNYRYPMGQNSNRVTESPLPFFQSALNLYTACLLSTTSCFCTLPIIPRINTTLPAPGYLDTCRILSLINVDQPRK